MSQTATDDDAKGGGGNCASDTSSAVQRQRLFGENAETWSCCRWQLVPPPSPFIPMMHTNEDRLGGGCGSGGGCGCSCGDAAEGCASPAG